MLAEPRGVNEMPPLPGVSGASDMLGDIASLFKRWSRLRLLRRTRGVEGINPVLGLDSDIAELNRLIFAVTASTTASNCSTLPDVASDLVSGAAISSSLRLIESSDTSS